jgi:predicted phosphodiesterase
MRTFVVGDTHGIKEDLKKIKEWPEQKFLTKKDILIQLGDFGLIWYHDKHPKYKQDQNELRELAKRNFTTVFLKGNHENHELIAKAPEIEMFGSKVKEVYPGIYCLQNGHIYTINRKTFFIMGGARSNENQKEGNYSGRGRNKKLKKQKVWWPEEIPSEEEFELGLSNLAKYNYKVDYILTHTCPNILFSKIYNKTGQIDFTRMDDPVSLYLNEIENLIDFKEWHFGHHHQDFSIGAFFCHYHNYPFEIK